MDDLIPVDSEKVDKAKGIQHWSLALNRGQRFTDEELQWFPGRVDVLRRYGYNKYHIAKIIASEIDRSIDSMRYQLWHSMKLWPKRPTQLQIEGSVQTVSVARYWMAVNEVEKLQLRIIQLEQVIRGFTNKGGGNGNDTGKI